MLLVAVLLAFASPFLPASADVIATAAHHPAFAAAAATPENPPLSSATAGSNSAQAVPPPPPGPLSLRLDELTSVLGAGVGRSRAAWDCYRAGVDPALFYDRTVPDADLDASVTRLLGQDLQHVGAGRAIAEGGDYDGVGTKKKKTTTTREEIYLHHLPATRRTQGLGVPAVRAMKRHWGGGEDGLGGGIEANVGTISRISQARDGTTKLLVKLASDGLEVETVIIPWDETGRSTLCISSQVGCRQGCTFCATGRMGIQRSLTVDEILVQVYLSRKVCRLLDGLYPVDGVVFMGMGEPADNSDAVVSAATVLTDGEQFGMAKTRVTISTVGPSPDAFAALGRAPTALAWSVHATRDELRRVLVPSTRHTMEELRRAYLDALLARPVKLRTTMIEVALIADVNDMPEEADHLATFVAGMREEVPGMKPLVNLIPFNDIGHPTYRKPSAGRVMAFRDRLAARGVKCVVRTTRGDDESAACGQLATKKVREK